MEAAFLHLLITFYIGMVLWQIELPRGEFYMHAYAKSDQQMEKCNIHNLLHGKSLQQQADA